MFEKEIIIIDKFITESHGYNEAINSFVEMLIEKDENIIFELVNQYYATKMFGFLNENIAKNYINKVKDSKDIDKIYKCACAIGKSYPKEMNELLNLTIKSKNPERIISFARFVPNLSEKQFVKLAKATVDLKDIGCIVELSSYTGNRSSVFNCFNILNDYVFYILRQEDKELVKNIIDYISAMQENIKGIPSSGVPISHAVDSQMLNFKKRLIMGYNYLKEISGDNSDLLDEQEI